MAIKFNCHNCRKELIVKDELAGQLGKCPNCKSTLTVPSAAAPPPVAKRVGENEVPVAAAVDDVVVAEVVDDEDDAPVKKRRASRDEDDDEDDDRRSRVKKKSSRRDDDDDDDPDRRSAISTSKRKARRDDDDDDRPRKQQSRRGDDDEDSRDEDPDKKKKRRDRERRRMWEKSSTGMLLHQIGAWVYAGVFGLLLVAAIITLLMGFAAAAGAGPGGLVAGGGFVAVFSYLAGALFLGSVIVGLVGDVFLITTPGKNGEKALAITSLAMHAAVLLFGLLMFAAPLIILVIPILEIARLTMFCIFMWAMCKSLRAYDSAAKALQVGILLPCVAVGAILVNVLLASVLVSKVQRGVAAGVQTGAVVMVVLYLVELCAAVGLMYWHALVVRQCSSEIE